MTKYNWLTFVSVSFLAMSGAMLLSCSDEKKVSTDVGTVSPPEASEAPTSAKKKPEPVREDPDWALKGKPVKVAFSTILISYKGALRAGPSITRTKDQARVLAEKVYAEVSAGSDFGAVAKKYSEGPEAKRGGVVGVLMSNLLPDQMSAAILLLEEGGISKPVETPFGFQLLRRDPVEEIYLAQIRIGYGQGGASGNPARSRAEAKMIAAEASAAISEKKMTFAQAVEKYSDPPKKNRGGLIGRIPRGVLPAAEDKVAFALTYSEISAPVESVDAVVIMQRLPEITARHILITHRESAEKRLVNPRSKEEAAAIASKALKDIRAGEDFQMLAMSISDCPSRSSGGNLGEIAEGVMPEAFDRVAFSLQVGATSEVVESEFGFHVIQRVK